MAALEDAGLQVVLGQINGNIADVKKTVDALDRKVDYLGEHKVNVSDFNAYKDLRMDIDRQRRATVRWALSTIVAVFAMLAAWSAIIIATRPAPVVIDGLDSGLVLIGLWARGSSTAQ